jgi:putative Ca2+/H+ antiporter (TMEM165/GDT1 family)
MLKIMAVDRPLSKVVLLGVFFFALICVVNWDARYEKPVWDTVGGVFSPAIYLYETGFDFRSLLGEDGFPQAGPNVHVFTPITPVTAVVMWLLEGNNEGIYFTLHLIQFVLTGLLLSILFWFCKPFFGLFASVGIVLATFFFPPFLVQSRYMYMEIGGSLFVLLAYAGWVRGQYRLASVSVVVACAVKSFGLPVMLALNLLLLLERGDRVQRLKYIIPTSLSCIAIEAVRWVQGTNMSSPAGNDYLSYFFNQFYNRLSQTPDMLFIVLVLLIGGGWFLLKNSRSFGERFMGKKGQTLAIEERMFLAGMLIIFSFLGFIATVPLSGKGFYPLTRYYIWIWPVLIVTLCSFLYCVLGRFQERKLSAPTLNAVISGVIILLALFFWVNKSGKFYPHFGEDITAFSIAERSFEYQSFSKLQSSLLASAEKIEDGDVYLNLFDTYYTSSPIMGYVKSTKPNFKNIVSYHENQADINEYPDKFFMVLSNVAHGGHYMRAILTQALKDGESYRVELLDQYDVGGFKGSIIGVTRIQ